MLPFIDNFIKPVFARLNSRSNFRFSQFLTQSSATMVDSIEYLGFPQPGRLIFLKS